MSENQDDDFNRLQKTILEKCGTTIRPQDIAAAQIASDMYKDRTQNKLKEVLDNLNDSTLKVHSETIELTKSVAGQIQTAIEQLSSEVSSFVETVKNESASSSKLSEKMLKENRRLTWFTFGLAVVTTWMAISTADLAKQGHDSHEREAAEIQRREELWQKHSETLKREKTDLDNRVKQFQKEKTDWLKSHTSEQKLNSAK